MFCFVTRVVMWQRCHAEVGRVCRQGGRGVGGIRRGPGTKLHHSRRSGRKTMSSSELCGRPTYSLLRRLLAPRRPSEVLPDESSRLFTERYSPRPSVIVQQYHFYCQVQKEGEAKKDFIAELWKLASPCAFGQELDNNLREQLVHGI